MERPVDMKGGDEKGDSDDLISHQRSRMFDFAA